jgi:hypothetical protein
MPAAKEALPATVGVVRRWVGHLVRTSSTEKSPNRRCPALRKNKEAGGGGALSITPPGSDLHVDPGVIWLRLDVKAS